MKDMKGMKLTPKQAKVTYLLQTNSVIGEMSAKINGTYELFTLKQGEPGKKQKIAACFRRFAHHKRGVRKAAWGTLCPVRGRLLFRRLL